MRFTLRENEWVLDFLNTAEWHFVSEISDLASGARFAKEISESILPCPIVDALGKPEYSEATQEWDEFVKPDIVDGFAQDRLIVAQDIEKAEKVDNPLEWFEEEEDIPANLPEGPMWRVVVPTEHTEQWYSTLNQTRILMNKAHGLAEDGSRFLLSFLGMSSGIPPEKALLLAQYEFYCVIQNILVENLMN
jgi:hypothetical protein